VGYQHIHLFAGIGAFALGMAWAGYPSSIRTITAGFPCQNISNAGRREGITGEQSGLWKEAYRLIQETIDMHMGPDIILLEHTWPEHPRHIFVINVGRCVQLLGQPDAIHKK
jgi:site-specific DNA-cytosine methylase